MQRLAFDQAEFSSGSEQSLVVMMASVREHTDLTTFLTACGIQRDLGVPATASWERSGMVTETMRRLLRIELPYVGNWRKVLIFRDEWDTLKVAVDADAWRFYYEWQTTA
jgi:hypothetical protein